MSMGCQIVTVWKAEVAQRNGDFLGYFLLSNFLFTFSWTNSCCVVFVVGILGFQEWKWFDADVLDFQIKLWCRYIVGLGN